MPQAAWLWRAAAAGLAVVLAGCSDLSLESDAVLPSSTRLAADRVPLPSVADFDFIVVPVMLNGTGPYRFVIDTGADLPVIATDVALAAGLKLHGGVSVVTQAGEYQIISGRVNRLQIGGFEADAVPVGVVPVEYLGAFRQTHRVDGLIGLSVFNDCLLELDFARRHAAVDSHQPNRWANIPSLPYEGPHLLVPATLEGNPLPLILDTGNALPFVFGSDREYLSASPPVKDPFPLSGVGTSGPIYGSVGMLKSTLRLGPLAWTTPTIRFQPLTPTGIIGTAALRGVSLGIDARNRRLYFLKRELAATPDPDRIE